MHLAEIMLTSGVLIWIACAPAPAQQRKSDSASACTHCHAAQATSQPLTPMGRALELPGANPTLAAHRKMTFRRGAYSYTIETIGDKSTYTVTDGANVLSLPILWSFGTGAQTWILQFQDQLYVSRVTYYPALDGLDITMGENQITPHTLEEAMGRPMPQSEAKTCFGCHTTNALSDRKLNLKSMEPGVTCEHCHAGTSAHLVDALQGIFDSAPPKLGKLSSEDISTFCGQCHRAWETVMRGNLQGETNVRFQPYRLANSKCFDGTDARISCLACHDPHQDVVREDSSYDAKCLSCHTSSTRPAAATARAEAPMCPVAKVNCVSCHMPKVNLPGGHIVFTDHEIRILKPGEPYPD